jgi:quercetin dioxygenase-like cupin family protein
MSTVNHTLIGLFSATLVACNPATTETPNVANASGASEIVAAADVTEDAADWGRFLPYFTDDTHALSPILVGVAKIDAGQQIHPPHRHADEEYLMVTKGRGIWSLNGVQTPAGEGDILFARSWDYHGIRAADDSPLEFVVFKYSGREGAMPTDPNPSLPEERAQ